MRKDFEAAKKRHAAAQQDPDFVASQEMPVGQHGLSPQETRRLQLKRYSPEELKADPDLMIEPPTKGKPAVDAQTKTTTKKTDKGTTTTTTTKGAVSEASLTPEQRKVFIPLKKRYIQAAIKARGGRGNLSLTRQAAASRITTLLAQSGGDMNKFSELVNKATSGLERRK